MDETHGKKRGEHILIDGLTTEKPENEVEITAALATVMGKGVRGLILQFDGEEAPREKQFKCNPMYQYVYGERVLVRKISGTYIVENPIGSVNLYRTVTFQYDKQDNGTVSWGDDIVSVGFSDVNYSGVDIRTMEPIDLTDISKILFKLYFKKFSDPNGLYLGAVKEKLAGSAPSPWDANFAAYVKLGKNMLGRRIHTVDVSELTGEYYICTHGFSQKYDILSVQLI